MRYFIIDKSGRVIGQYFRHNSDPLPDNYILAGDLPEVQIRYYSSLTWNGKEWLYDGPKEIEVVEAEPAIEVGSPEDLDSRKAKVVEALTAKGFDESDAAAFAEIVIY